MKKLIFLLVSSAALLTANANEEWKAKYFEIFPEADSNKDGELSWPEFKAHKTMFDEYFKKNPDADTNKDGKMNFKEFKAHKKANK